MKTAINKQRIQAHVHTYVDRIGSQNKAANTLRGISPATLSQLLNNNWDLISDEMWRSIAAQTGYQESDWNAVETRDYRLLMGFLTDAKENSNVFAITGEAGSGKSFTMRRFANENKNVFLLQCAEYWNRKMFLNELLSNMGRDGSGLNVNEMMYEVVKNLKMTDRPLLLLDEADKLPDQVLYFFITLYNQLEDHCGIVLCATDHLSKRIRRGLRVNRKGYKEIYSRIARRFIELKGVSSNDIIALCKANGIDDTKLIKDVINDAEGDLRRVRRRIHALQASPVTVD